MPDQLIKRWSLTGVRPVERLQTFPTRFVERIVCDQGAFAVKVDHAPSQLVQGAAEVQAAAARALPRHVPAILPDLTGALAVQQGGRRIMIFEDLGGGRPPATAATWAGLGVIMARLHTTVIAHRPFAIPVQASADELDQWADGQPFADELKALTDRVRRIEERPTGTIHGEVNLSNVGIRPTGELVILDWDAAGTGPTAIDLGYPLICVFHGEDLTWHDDHAAAFYRGYARSGTDDQPSPDQIFDAAVLHAMRYLRYGDTARRWARLTQVLEREAELRDFLGDALIGGRDTDP